MNKIKNSKGITLIALVITIILIIILAGISINLLFGQYGIITRAKEQQEIQMQAEILQDLELQKGEVIIDGQGYTDLEKYKDYLENILNYQLNGHEITEITDIIEDETGRYIEIWVDGKYYYTAAQIENNVVINAKGYLGKMSPKIENIVVETKTSTNIKIEVIARMTETYNFYIKKLSDSEYTYVGCLKGENSNNSNLETITYEYTDLTEGEKYNIKVIAENTNGETEKELAIDTIPIPTITISDANTWTNGTKTITISEISGYTIKYTIKYATDTTDATVPSVSNGTIYTEAFTVNSNCIITAAYFDSTNQMGKAITAEVTKIDTVVPGQATINTNGYNAGKYTTSATVSLTASATDSYGEIDHYEFTINGGNSVASTSNPYSITDNYCSKTVYARAVDKAGNVGPWSSAVVVKKGKTLASVASQGQLVSYNGNNWRVYTNDGTTVVLAGLALSNVTLSGYSHWANCVTNLNNIATNYQLNTTYATYARSININDALNLLVSWGFKGYWLATTHGPEGNGVWTYYGVNVIDANGNYGFDSTYENIYVTHTNGATANQSFTYNVAALVALKTGLVTSGTSGGVWQLVAPR